MDIKCSGSQPSNKGSEAYFTSTVRVDAPFSGSGNLSGATVTFEPGARTAWHTHPLGQTLLIIAGLGCVQREGGPVEEIRPATWSGSSLARGTGAAPRPTARCRTSPSAECQDGEAVTWMEKVCSSRYGGQARR